ncbi:MAG: hypothetical protein JXA87_03680 [Thermoleophilia bacterium]|nr:hypothetical protein [Thermoleophilia bacterium]
MQSTGRSFREAARAGRRGARRRLLAGGMALLLSIVMVCSAVGCDTPGPENEPTSVISTARTGSAGTTTTEGEPATTGATAESVATSETRPGKTTTSVTIGELGGRRNPIPVGQEAQIGGWNIKVLDATLDATQAVLDENMFNDPPEPGSQYLLVSIEATYLGAETSTFWVDMIYEFVGGEGAPFKPSAAVAPDSILDDGEVSANGTVSGNLLFTVASDQVAGGTLMIEQAFAHDDTRVFFAVR